MPISKNRLHDLVSKKALGRGWRHPVMLGLMDREIFKLLENNKDFLYVDHSYFNRGWNKENFRLTRRWVHLTEVKPRNDDRLKKFEVAIHPWRKKGNKIVVIPPTDFQKPLGCYHWTENTEKRLKEITDRPIVVKYEKGGFKHFIDDAWAVVTWASVAGVEAALLGVPVFSTDKCPSFPVSSGPIENIETPIYPENRHEWACSLAYASWHISEMGKIDFQDYDYSIRNDVS